MASTGKQVMDRVLSELEERQAYFERGINVAVRGKDYSKALEREAKLKETQYLIAYIGQALRDELEV